MSHMQHTADLVVSMSQNSRVTVMNIIRSKGLPSGLLHNSSFQMMWRGTVHTFLRSDIFHRELSDCPTSTQNVYYL